MRPAAARPTPRTPAVTPTAMSASVTCSGRGGYHAERQGPDHRDSHHSLSSAKTRVALVLFHGTTEGTLVGRAGSGGRAPRGQVPQPHPFHYVSSTSAFGLQSYHDRAEWRGRGHAGHGA